MGKIVISWPFKEQWLLDLKKIDYYVSIFWWCILGFFSWTYAIWKVLFSPIKHWAGLYPLCQSLKSMGNSHENAASNLPFTECMLTWKLLYCSGANGFLWQRKLKHTLLWWFKVFFLKILFWHVYIALFVFIFGCSGSSLLFMCFL